MATLPTAIIIDLASRRSQTNSSSNTYTNKQENGTTALWEKLNILQSECYKAVNAIVLENNNDAQLQDDIEKIDVDTLLSANAFINTFYLDIPKPDIYADIDGCIRIEWYKDKLHLISLSLGQNTINYSAFFGERDRDFGVKPIGTEFHLTIKNLIEKVYTDE